MKPSWYAVLAVLILAGAIHVVAVLSLPHLAQKTGWTRLSALSKPNRIVILPTASPSNQAIPLMAPDVRYAFCRYDLDAGPVRLESQILDELWLIAFYTPHGDNFYTISGGDIQRDKIEIIISSQADQIFDTGDDPDEEKENVVIVNVPEKHGVVLIRAPLPSASYAARTEDALRQATCSRFLRTARLTRAPAPPG